MTISAVILTFNESIHIKRCIDSIYNFVDHIYILDSFSTDNTLNILEKYKKVTVKQNKWINYASQFNFALDNFDINSDWIMRIDADEYIDADLSNWLVKNLDSVSPDINGIYFNRYMTFMGKLMQHGGMDSYWMLRMWRNGTGHCEQRWMDEHIVLNSGNTIKASGKLIDDNINTLSWWAHKHVDYSTREAIDILLKDREISDVGLDARLTGSKAERTRYFKKIYNKIPLFVRPFFYFIYRYFFKFGFKDGKEGFLWNILQGFWYRMMVDAKVYEIKKNIESQNKSLSEVVKDKYGYEI